MSATRSGVTKPPRLGLSRRAPHFWQPLNDWWRAYFADKGTRPVSSEVLVWFNEHGDAVWGDAKPTWKETRIHAKCLRSTEQVKHYFRGYRARKSGEYKDDSKPSDSGSLDMIKIEEDAHAPQLPTRCSLVARRPPLHSGPPSAPTSSDRIAEQPLLHASSDGMSAGDPTASTASIFASLNLSRNPTTTLTITTGRWQQRSASECFPPGFRAQLQELQQIVDRPPRSNPSQSSMVFHTPSLSAHSRKPVSPFILTQGNNEHGSDPTPASFFQDSTTLAMCPKAQSFSCSSKRRHTNDSAYSIPTSPAYAQHAASFSQAQGSAHPSLASHYGVPLTHRQQPQEYVQETEVAGPFFSHASAPASNLQRVSYPVGSIQQHSPGGPELPAHECGFRQLSSEEPGTQPLRQQSLMGSMDRQLVADLARDAAARSSRIEQAACSASQPGPSTAAAMPCIRTGRERAFYPGRPQTFPLLPSPPPAEEPLDAEFAYFWGEDDKEQALQ